MFSRRSLLQMATGLGAIGISTTRVLAESAYPSRLIKIVVGNAPGGTDDLISRTLGQYMTSRWAQPVIIENRGGASTTIAGGHVASAPNDGYTILCLIGTSIVQTVLREKMRYSLDSFSPIVGVGGFPLGLAVSSSGKIKTMEDLKAAAKAPGGVKFASGGVGTMGHLNAVKFLKSIGGSGLHVPYRNNPECLQAIAAGFADMMFASVSEVAPMRGDGMLRVLAVSSQERSSNLTDVPTTRELGLPQIDTVLWHGFVAPAGTPPSVVAKLADTITQGVNEPDFQNRFRPLAFQSDVKTGAALTSFLTGEAARWREVITENNIRITD
jgi:tripartite-type tricarboxylate transporter receptor subunit TctC